MTGWSPNWGPHTGAYAQAPARKQLILTEYQPFQWIKKSRHGAGYPDYRSATNSVTIPPTSSQVTVPTCSPTRGELLSGWAPSRPESTIFGPSATYTRARCRCYRSVRTLSFRWVATVIHTWMCGQRGPAHGCLYTITNPPRQ